MSMVEVSAITTRLLKRCGDLTFLQAVEVACRVMLMRREVDRLHRRQQEIEALAYEAERTRMLREIADRFEATASKSERYVVAAMRGAAIQAFQTEEM